MKIYQQKIRHRACSQKGPSEHIKITSITKSNGVVFYNTTTKEKGLLRIEFQKNFFFGSTENI